MLFAIYIIWIRTILQYLGVLTCWCIQRKEVVSRKKTKWRKKKSQSQVSGKTTFSFVDETKWRGKIVNERICRDVKLLFVTDFQWNCLSVRWIKTMEREARIHELSAGGFHRCVPKLSLGNKSWTAAKAAAATNDNFLFECCFSESYFVCCVLK